MELLHGSGDVQRDYADWMELTSTLANRGFFHLPAWYLSYLESGDKEWASFLPIAVYCDNQLVALLPLQKRPRRPFELAIRVLEFPYTATRLHDILIAPEVTPECVFEILRKQLYRQCDVAWDVLRLNGIPAGMHLPAATQNMVPWLTNSRMGGYCNCIELPDDENYMDRVSRNHRYNLRRGRRQLDELGAVSFHVVDELPALESAFQEFVDLEGSGWKSQKGGKRAIKLNPVKKAFFRGVLQRFGAEGNCHVLQLRLEGKPIAAFFMVIVDDTAYQLKIGYDEDYSRMSPGNLLSEFMIKVYSADARIRLINLISDSHWHVHWRPSRLEVYDFYVFNRGYKGLLAYLVMRVKGKIKDMRRRNN